MANDKRTTMFVKRLVEDPNLFLMKFGEVMSWMSSLGVLTRKQGENSEANENVKTAPNSET
ncbi:peroxidase 60-like [Senna tora]|uniref:Peroxidase 60-like n=1 Tax=Senna tora TaxID=362788 RepID=A0A834SFH3_9FABA|nr:peroxidase 60-like [Senna tora]